MSEFIITHTGRKVYPFDIQPDDVLIEDIAHALSNKCRFTGHTEFFYSVAQHSVLVAEGLENLISNPLWGLLHDAAEAYLPDIATGLKGKFPELIIAEVKILSMVKQAFRLSTLPTKETRQMKAVDAYVLYWEGRALMPNHKEAVWGKPDSYLRKLHIEPLSPDVAKHHFLKYFDEHIN